MAHNLEQSSFYTDIDDDGELDENETIYYDLTTQTGSAAQINGALFFTDQPDSSSGTGLIQAFVRVQDGGNDSTPGFENGYNTDFRPLVYEENTSPSFTTNLLLSAIPKVIIDGVEYYEFRLDINQLNSSPFLSLDGLKLFTSDAGAGNAQGAIDGAWFQANASLVYDLDDNDLDGSVDQDNSILLDYSLQAGSGKSDMFFYVPVSSFAGLDPATTNITLYSEFGSTGALDQADNLIAIADGGEGNDESDDDPTAVYATYTSNDGFEEWSVSKTLDNNFISGFKWLDTDGDGVWDNTENGLSGWKIDYVITYKDGNGANAPIVEITGSTITSDGTVDVDGDGIIDPEGYYVIGVPLGKANNTTYTIALTENSQEGWVNTYDGDGVANFTTTFQFSENNLENNISVISGDFGATEAMNFGNFELFDISGTKYTDVDGDGTVDAEDTGLGGVTVFIDVDGDGELSAGDETTTTSAVDGSWSFTDLDASYDGLSVYEVLPSGYVQTLGTAGYAIVGTSGNDQTGFDFANFELFDISGAKYTDVDGDGTVDAEDTGLGGVTVFIDVDGDGELSAGDETTTTSAVDGSWSFTDLDASYDGLSVYEVLPSGYVQTLGTAGYAIVGTSGNDQTGFDFANFELMNLSGYKWADVDGDGEWDEGAGAVYEGWTIVIDFDHDPSNGYFLSTETGADGLYQFNNLGPDTVGDDGATTLSDDQDGTLHVYEIQQDGFTQSYNGGYTFSLTSGLVVAGALGVAEDGNFGNFMMEGANRTPGFWQSTLGQSFYDGIDGNEGDANGDGTRDGNKNFDEEGWSETDLLILYGKDLTGDGMNDHFEIWGDGDSIVEAGEIFLSPDELHSWVSGGDKGGGRDFSQILERDLGAAFLNSLNNDAISDAPGGDYAIDPEIMDSYSAAVDWILKYDPDFDGESTNVGGKKGQNKDWNEGQFGSDDVSGSDAHSELSAFNENGEVTDGESLLQILMDGDDYSSAVVQKYFDIEESLSQSNLFELELGIAPSTQEDMMLATQMSMVA